MTITGYSARCVDTIAGSVAIAAAVNTINTHVRTVASCRCAGAALS
jgi:hypothetical protein